MYFAKGQDLGYQKWVNVVRDERARPMEKVGHFSRAVIFNRGAAAH
jgi:hypothetical protein